MPAIVLLLLPGFPSGSVAADGAPCSDPGDMVCAIECGLAGACGICEGRERECHCDAFGVLEWKCVSIHVDVEGACTLDSTNYHMQPSHPRPHADAWCKIAVRTHAHAKLQYSVLGGTLRHQGPFLDSGACFFQLPYRGCDTGETVRISQSVLVHPGESVEVCTGPGSAAVTANEPGAGGSITHLGRCLRFDWTGDTERPVASVV